MDLKSTLNPKHLNPKPSSFGVPEFRFWGVFGVERRFSVLRSRV